MLVGININHVFCCKHLHFGRRGIVVLGGPRRRRIIHSWQGPFGGFSSGLDYSSRSVWDQIGVGQGGCQAGAGANLFCVCVGCVYE